MFSMLDSFLSKILVRCCSVALFKESNEMKFGNKGKISNGFQIDIHTIVFINKPLCFDQLANEVRFGKILISDFQYLAVIIGH